MRTVFTILLLTCLLPTIFSQTFTVDQFESLYRLNTLTARIEFLNKAGFIVDTSEPSPIPKTIVYSHKTNNLSEYIFLFDNQNQGWLHYQSDNPAAESYYATLLDKNYEKYGGKFTNKSNMNYRQKYAKMIKNKPKYCIELSVQYSGSDWKELRITYLNNCDD